MLLQQRKSSLKITVNTGTLKNYYCYLFRSSLDEIKQLKNTTHNI